MALKRIVIVGGGGAGASIARSFSQNLDGSHYSITLISARDYNVHLPGALRMLSASNGLEEKVLIPYDRLFINNNGIFIQGTVTSIVPNHPSGGKVILTNGDEVPYDALILATGSIWEGGLDLPPLRREAEDVVRNWRNDIEKSTGVVIVGGGAVGSEFAGEIRDAFPSKEVTIVHREHHLLNATYPDKFRIDVDNRFTRRQIHLVLDDELEDIPAYPAPQIITKNGTRLQGNLAIPCRGGRPNTAFIKSLGEDTLNSEGYVKVLPTLQLTNHPDIFAAGDIIAWKEVKQLAKYGGHAKTIATNIVSFLNNEPPKAEYKSMFEAIFLTNGSNGGAAYMDLLWGLCFGDWVTRTLKSSDLFITKALQGMGYP